ncbi:hypothetical protein BDC45DRAFT_586893 [Circinella umbellata]|nr:hypothetical protein BDC45DRAFT_586893 [Circinella umbellata]
MSPQKKTQTNSSESNGSSNLPVPVPIDASNARHNQPGSSVPVPVSSTPSSKTKKVLTLENTSSLLCAHLEAAALEFAKAVNTTPEEKARNMKDFKKSAAKENNDRLDNLVPKNMPTLQFKGGPIRDNAKPIHNSLESFISAFERQLKSHNLSLDNHWERLFWLCLNDNQISWFHRELVDKNRTWADACIEVQKEYSNPFHIFLKRYKLFAARPNTNWPIDIMEVSQLVISTLGENIDMNHTGGNNKRHLPVNEPTPSSKTKRKYGNFPVHLKGSHSASKCEVLKKHCIHVKENSTPIKLC